MAILTKIYMTDLQRWLVDRWVALNVQQSGSAGQPVSVGPDSGNKIQLMPWLGQLSPGGGIIEETHDPADAFRKTIAWDNLMVAQEGLMSLGWSIFGEDELLVGTALAKSVKIRYRLEVQDDADPANVYAPNAWYYQIILATHKVDHIQYSGMVPTGSFMPQLSVTLPGLTNAMVANSMALHSWMKERSNWRLTWTRPGGATREYTPDVATIVETSSDQWAGEYAGGKVVMALTFPQITIAHSGEHELLLEFLPNDQETGGFHKFADSETWVAVVTAYTPSMDDPLVLSFEKTVFLKISFAESGD